MIANGRDFIVMHACQVMRDPPIDNKKESGVDHSIVEKVPQEIHKVGKKKHVKMLPRTRKRNKGFRDPNS